jgi:hypothetical protein
MYKTVAFSSSTELASNCSTPLRSLSPQQSATSFFDDEFRKKPLPPSGLKSLISSAFDTEGNDNRSLASEPLDARYLSWEVLDKAVSQYNSASENSEGERDTAPLVNLLRTTFRNGDILNESFLVNIVTFNATEGLLLTLFHFYRYLMPMMKVLELMLALCEILTS